MDTSIEHAAHAAHDEHDAHEGHADGHGHPKDRFYVGIAIFLAVVTGLEVLIPTLGWGVIGSVLLYFLMVVKFFTVIMFFMRLRFDHKLFGYLFYGWANPKFIFLMAATTLVDWLASVGSTIRHAPV